METMEALWTSVTTVVTNLVTLMGTMSTSLLGNELFQIAVGVVVFGIGMGIVFTLLRKIRRRGN